MPLMMMMMHITRAAYSFRYRDVFRRAFEPLEHDVKQTLDHLFIHNRLSPFLIENSNITEVINNK
jgi:hypothetical protein